MQTINLTDEEKRQFLGEHFYYEVSMLVFCGGKIGEFQCARDTYSTNMALESFLFHARNLREFFYSETKRPDDARAYEFVKNKGEWEQLKPEETDSIKEVKRRSGKELAHLTYKRFYGTPPRKRWECGEVATDLLKLVKLFLGHLPSKYMSDRLRELQRRI